MGKLALDNPKRVLHFDYYTNLGFFNRLCQLFKRTALVQGPAFA